MPCCSSSSTPKKAVGVIKEIWGNFFFLYVKIIEISILYPHIEKLLLWVPTA
jgi:hypothetical protein